MTDIYDLLRPGAIIPVDVQTTGDLVCAVRELKAELQALRDKHAWRPIETAPRDGTQYLAALREYVDICHWDEMEGTDQSPQIVPMPDATEWMPLPIPSRKEKDDA